MQFSVSSDFHTCNSDFSVPAFKNIQHSGIKNADNRSLRQNESASSMTQVQIPFP